MSVSPVVERLFFTGNFRNDTRATFYPERSHEISDGFQKLFQDVINATGTTSRERRVNNIWFFYGHVHWQVSVYISEDNFQGSLHPKGEL